MIKALEKTQKKFFSYGAYGVNTIKIKVFEILFSESILFYKQKLE
jgi:hypothetical protein